MSGRQNVEDMVRSTETLQRDIKNFASDIREFESNFKATLERLEKDGLPKEFVENFRNKQMSQVTKQISSIGRFLENETLRYIIQVKQKITRLRDVIRR
ncbi:MAG: hypothetical protein ACJA2O_003991 [Candidatus Azotimanducaceae bacterium]|jgi:hypothetical protein